MIHVSPPPRSTWRSTPTGGRCGRWWLPSRRPTRSTSSRRRVLRQPCFRLFDAVQCRQRAGEVVPVRIYPIDRDAYRRARQQTVALPSEDQSVLVRLAIQAVHYRITHALTLPRHLLAGGGDTRQSTPERRGPCSRRSRAGRRRLNGARVARYEARRESPGSRLPPERHHVPPEYGSLPLHDHHPLPLYGYRDGAPPGYLLPVGQPSPE